MAPQRFPSGRIYSRTLGNANGGSVVINGGTTNNGNITGGNGGTVVSGVAEGGNGGSGGSAISGSTGDANGGGVVINNQPGPGSSLTNNGNIQAGNGGTVIMGGSGSGSTSTSTIQGIISGDTTVSQSTSLAQTKATIASSSLPSDLSSSSNAQSGSISNMFTPSTEAGSTLHGQSESPSNTDSPVSSNSFSATQNPPSGPTNAANEQSDRSNTKASSKLIGGLLGAFIFVFLVCLITGLYWWKKAKVPGRRRKRTSHSIEPWIRGNGEQMIANGSRKTSNLHSAEVEAGFGPTANNLVRTDESPLSPYLYRIPILPVNSSAPAAQAPREIRASFVPDRTPRHVFAPSPYNQFTRTEGNHGNLINSSNGIDAVPPRYEE
ncbi:hypothetical protein M422DRAFT_66306 [Sphaerobolus stellatus SS14]|nr:hypothetical protein M422DRAFT_66306 [Sphaerobolus stellatus SS14]